MPLQISQFAVYIHVCPVIFVLKTLKEFNERHEVIFLYVFTCLANKQILIEHKVVAVTADGSYKF